MAIFVRQEPKAGEVSVIGLILGNEPSSVDTPATVRLSQTDCIKVSGPWDAASSLKMVPGSRGRRVIASAPSSQRTLNFTFLSSDTSGAEEMAVRNFFSYPRAISYTDSERGIPTQNFFVSSVELDAESGGASITVEGAAEYDSAQTQKTQNIGSGKIADLAAGKAMASFTNDLGFPCSLRLTLSSADGSAADIVAGAITLSAEAGTTSLGSIGFSVLRPYQGVSIILDSLDEVVRGAASVDASLGVPQFFTVAPGQAVVATVKSAAVIPGGIYSLDAFYTGALGLWSTTPAA